MSPDTPEQPVAQPPEKKPGTNVLDEICQWAKGLPYWEQVALDQIVAGANIDDAAVDQLLVYLLEDAGLVKKGAVRPELAILKRTPASDTSTAASPRRLVSLSGLRFVNALTPGQTLTFGPGMTAIFGANGSGKSGYARVLASAAFTRGDRDVLKDVTKPDRSSDVMSAEVHLDDGSGAKTHHYRIGDAFPEMQSFYVFDSTSVHVHLGEANTVSFSPAGLGYLTRLTEVTDTVRERLQAKISERTRPNPFQGIFRGVSQVSTALAVLGADTDLAPMRLLAEVKPEEEKRVDALDKKIAELKSEKIPEKLKAMATQIADLKRLRESFQALAKTVGEEAIERVNSLVTKWLALKAAADAQSLDPFKADSLTQVGSDPWVGFVRAAKALAQSESGGGLPYPQADSRCLLCLQPLSEEARNMLVMLWRLLESDAQKNLQLLNDQIDKEATRVERINTALLPEDSAVYRTLERLDEELLKTARAKLGVFQERQEGLVTALRTRKETTLAAAPPKCLDLLEAPEKKLAAEREKLAEKNPQEEIQKLTQQKLELEHRLELRKRLAEVEKYVADCKWVATASAPKTRGSSRHITNKHNQLFDQLVTKRYVELFQQNLTDLQCPLTVQIKTTPSKGRTLKQLGLKTHASFPASRATTEKVLSEGEQRAVAIADFLTEVGLDTNSSGVILDDPVSSLDFEWKETIATHLAQEACNRQAIVFTHDLHFLYCLKKAADAAKAEIVAHSIECRADEPGWVFLENAPASEQDYKSAKIPREWYAKAKAPGLPSDRYHSFLDQGFGSLRSCYEAFVVFELFGGVVLRFGERISGDRLKEVHVNAGIRDEVVEKIGTLSRYIGAHLHSDTFAAQKPDAKKLLEEIEFFEELKKRHRELKKQAASP